MKAEQRVEPQAHTWDCCHLSLWDLQVSTDPWEYLSIPVTSGVSLTVLLGLTLTFQQQGRVCRLRFEGEQPNRAAEDCLGNFCFLGLKKFFFLSSRDAGDWAVILLSRDPDGHCAQMTSLCWSWQRVVSASVPPSTPKGQKDLWAWGKGRQTRQGKGKGWCVSRMLFWNG